MVSLPALFVSKIMAKKRLEYIDIAKGILVLFVVLGHLLAALYKEQRGDLFLSAALTVKDFLWVPYYMPAFFIITGFCSNFDKPFKRFFVSNLKTIKLPAIIFGILYMSGHLFNHHELNTASFLKMLACSPIHCGYWFLDTMFIIKMMQWGGHKIINNLYAQLTIGFALAFLGAYLINTSSLTDDYFSVCHSLLLYWTIPFGQILKKYNVEIGKKVAILLTIGYIVFYVLAKELAYVPSVTSKVTISLPLVPANIILSICGAISILSLCKYIKSNKVLAYCGINSLIFYCVHLIALSPVLKIGKIGGAMIPLSTVTALIDIILLIVICIIATQIINKTILKVILGKF